MKRLGYRYQRTLARPMEVRGVGFLTGATIQLRFRPAPPSTGVVFVRTDQRRPSHIPARIEQVTGTARRTTLGSGQAQVSLVEHVLAALAGMRIDNCFVDLNAPEPPGLDGSTLGFVQALVEAGSVLQGCRRAIYAVEDSVVVMQAGCSLALHPTCQEGLRISYTLNYGPHSPIDRQTATHQITPESFGSELAGCRTFILETEATELRRQGLGARTTTADLLVFGKHGPIENTLRFANEPARHKVLDMVGDLSLLGHDLCGHVVAYRSGHPLNIQLVQALNQLLENSNPHPRAQLLAA